jgi:hypothetical protein
VVNLRLLILSRKGNADQNDPGIPSCPSQNVGKDGGEKQSLCSIVGNVK